MRIWKLYLLVCLLPLLCSTSEGDTLKSQQRDLKVFKSVVLSKEGTLNLHVNQKVIDKALKNLDKKFEEPQNLLSQFKYYSRFLSEIQCGHTQIHPNKEVFREWLSQRNSLPIDVYLIGRHLVVNKLSQLDFAYAPSNIERVRFAAAAEIPAGSEILEINNKSVPEMIELMSPYLSSDENGIDFKYFQAKELFEFYRHLCDPFTKDSIQIKYVSDKDTLELSLTTGQAPVRTINERLRKSTALFDETQKDLGQFRIDGNYGYFRFRSFRLSYGKRFEEFLKHSFAVLKSKKIEKLIIDLRGNTGGAMQYQFIRYIVGEEVNIGKYIVGKPKKVFENSHLIKMSPEYFKHIRASRSQRRSERRGDFENGKVVTEKVDKNLVYNGEIVVITDEGTFKITEVKASSSC